MPTSGSIADQVKLALPGAIWKLVDSQGSANFSFFHASKNKYGSIKLSPHSSMRLPHLINCRLVSPALNQLLCAELNLPQATIAQVIDEITQEARDALAKGAGSSFVIDNLCMIYMDSGKIRISSIN